MQETQEIIMFDTEPCSEIFKNSMPVIKSGEMAFYSVCSHCKTFYCQKCVDSWTPEEQKMMEGVKA